MLKKILFSLLSFLFLFSLFSTLLVTKKVQAAAQFSTGYDISFVFSDNGQARVTQKIALTNLTDNLYASEYNLTISSEKISDVSGSDGSGSITVSAKTEEKSTVLTARLNQKIVGKDKAVNFQISYTIDSLATKRGRVWEVNIPQIVTSESVSGYKLTLSVPESFGTLGRMSPEPDQNSVDGGTRHYTFTQTTQGSSGIGASFGDYQIFKFALKYRYKNTNLYTANATIALPPDTEYQALYYQSLEPKPSKMELDESGNYLATYTIKAGKTLEITTSGFAKLIDADKPFQIPKDWSKEELAKFTKADKFIESENAQIQKKATELENVKAIYDYVTSALKYDYSRLEGEDKLGRRGALEAFNNPEKSICTDFSDLFVALARAKGIPARGLIGFAYADNSDLRPTKVEGLVDTTVLHAWPEYYDSERGHWVQVDPTWGATTGGVDYFNRLDTNHFVFSIYGTSSEFPYPAGAYKLSANEVDDVKVEIVDQTFEQAPEPELKLDTDKVISGFPAGVKLVVTNNNGRALFKSKVDLAQNNVLGLTAPKTIAIGTVLPFGSQAFDLRLRSTSLLVNSKETLNFKLTGLDQSKEITLETKMEVVVRPFLSFELPQMVLFAIFLVVVASWVIPRFSFRAPSHPR